MVRRKSERALHTRFQRAGIWRYDSVFALRPLDRRTGFRSEFSGTARTSSAAFEPPIARENRFIGGYRVSLRLSVGIDESAAAFQNGNDHRSCFGSLSRRGVRERRVLARTYRPARFQDRNLLAGQ